MSLHIKLLSRFWPHILAAAAVIGAVWYFSHARYTAGYEAARAEIQAELEREREHQREVNEESERVHQENVNALQARISKLMRRTDAIRLCEPAGELRAGADPGESAGGSRDGHALRAGSDLQPRLVLYGGQCRKLQQQLIEIKARQEALRGS